MRGSGCITGIKGYEHDLSLRTKDQHAAVGVEMGKCNTGWVTWWGWRRQPCSWLFLPSRLLFVGYALYLSSSPEVTDTVQIAECCFTAVSHRLRAFSPISYRIPCISTQTGSEDPGAWAEHILKLEWCGIQSAVEITMQPAYGLLFWKLDLL